MKKGKRYNEAAKLVDKAQQYSVADALDLAVKTASAKWKKLCAAIRTISPWNTPVKLLSLSADSGYPWIRQEN